MLFKDPPEIISPSPGAPELDQFIYRAGLNVVTVLVPGPTVRTQGDEERAHARVEAEAAKRMATLSDTLILDLGF